MDLGAPSAISLCLAKNVIANIYMISTKKELSEKLEQLYQRKGILNQLYLKEQFHTLCMNRGTKISDHVSVRNHIVLERRLSEWRWNMRKMHKGSYWLYHIHVSIWSIIWCIGKRPWCMHVLWNSYQKRTVWKEAALLRQNEQFWYVGNSLKNPICWKCGQSGQVKINFLGEAVSKKRLWYN